MNTMKIKNNFYNGYQSEMQKCQDGGAIHSKHNILRGTVHDYLENEKYFL